MSLENCIKNRTSPAVWVLHATATRQRTDTFHWCKWKQAVCKA